MLTLREYNMRMDQLKLANAAMLHSFSRIEAPTDFEQRKRILFHATQALSELMAIPPELSTRLGGMITHRISPLKLQASAEVAKNRRAAPAEKKRPSSSQTLEMIGVRSRIYATREVQKTTDSVEKLRTDFSGVTTGCCAT